MSFKTPEVAEDCRKLAEISPTLSEAAKVAPGDRPIKVYTRIVRQLYSTFRLQVWDLANKRSAT